MEAFNIILLAIIQGITEWLPISSSGHLVLAEQLLNIEVPFYYNILLHLSTLIVILLVFYKEIINIILAFIKLDFKSNNGKMGVFILLGSIPTAIIGFTFHDIFVSFFSNIKVVAFGLIATSLLLFSTKYVKSKRKMKWYDSLLVGTAQGLAIIPGVSRSGSTISTGLIFGVKKEQITTFSFLLSIPAILGAVIFDFSPEPISAIMVFGLLLTVIIGYISLRILIKLILNDKFHYFGYYCLIVGIIILII